MKQKVKDYSKVFNRQILHEAYRAVLKGTSTYAESGRVERAYQQMQEPYFWDQQNKHTSSGEDCTCLDHRTRKVVCKHMYTFRILEEYTRLCATAVKDGMILTLQVRR